MPRIKQVPLADAHKNAKRHYGALFNGQDPVAHPGTATGTPGHWWTTIALRPYVFDHAAAGLAMYSGMFCENGPDSLLCPKARELAITRTGYAVGSQFVFSQHCKVSLMAGLEEDKIKAIPHWTVFEGWDTKERAILAYTDAVVLQYGRVPDALFDALKSEMSDEDIMELTYHITEYVQHAILCKALRLEYDDVDDRIVEVPMPGGADFKTWVAEQGLDLKSTKAEQR
ncbi:MAG: alkylhydroperoxidase family enzyme [Marinomonas primoryensis]|jgi:alkylhydroperoxidase family enzyme